MWALSRYLSAPSVLVCLSLPRACVCVSSTDCLCGSVFAPLYPWLGPWLWDSLRLSAFPVCVSSAPVSLCLGLCPSGFIPPHFSLSRCLCPSDFFCLTLCFPAFVFTFISPQGLEIPERWPAAPLRCLDPKGPRQAPEMKRQIRQCVGVLTSKQPKNPDTRKTRANNNQQTSKTNRQISTAIK